MSSNDDPIDFGGRFARQFFNNNWPNIEGDPTTSTPVASDNSICDSGYEQSFQARRKSISPIDINNNNNCGSTNTTPNLIKSNNSTTGDLSLSQYSTTTSIHALAASINSRNDLSSGSNNLTSNSNNCSQQLQQFQQQVQTLQQQAQSATSAASTSVNNATASALVAAAVAVARSAISTNRRSNSLFTTLPPVISNPWSSQEANQRLYNVDKIERAASLHRTAASYSEPQYTWSGQLPSRSYKNPVYSCKVFLGGVPWDVTEEGLIETFGRFGPLRVQWPGKDGRQPSGQTKAGYVYLIYESERYVKALLSACTQDFGSGSHPEKYFYQLSSRRMRFKEVEVIPWVIADSNYIRSQFGRPDTNRTVFVGALHGMLTAEGLAKIMNDLFGNVAYVGIDSDKHKYPLGSGRVTFISQRSYMKAVQAAFIEVKSSQFCKKIQLDPYFGVSSCSVCHIQSGPIYCRDCLRYFCKTCWNWHHSTELLMNKHHRPLMRKKRET